MLHLTTSVEEPLHPHVAPPAPPASETARGRRAKGGKGAISCAECRRLKIRCDLTKLPRAPCSSCEKRGCGEICPEGALQTGKGSRYILSNTADLHRTIDDLRKRITELEDALAVSHATHSSTRHRLLQPDKLRIGIASGNPDADNTEERREDSKHGLDTLMIAENGRAQWLGTSASSEWFVDIDDLRPVPRPPTIGDGWRQKSVDVEEFVSADPEYLTEDQRREFRAQLLSGLPSHAELVHLANLYYTQAGWLYNPVPRPRFDQIITSLYSGSDELVNNVYNQELSIVFSILAIGELMSDKNPPYSPTQKKYAYYSKLAICIDCIYVHTGIATIEAMLLRALYMLLNDDPGSAQKVWGYLGLICKLAMSIGLHRDPSYFDLKEEECVRRRRLWWEFVSMDAWQSISFGRPNAINRNGFDTRVPYSDIATQEGEEHRFQQWKYTFVSTILLDIIDQCLIIRAKPTVATVLKLEQRVRDYTVPSEFIAPIGEDPTQPAEATIFQRNIMFCIREATILLLNRAFFIHALHEDIKDPLCSKFAASVLSVHASASALLGRGRTLLAFQQQAPRFWVWWSQTFTAMVSLAAICVKAPGCTLAPSALEEVDIAVELFQKASEGYRARRLANAVRTLHDRAHASMDAYRQGNWVRTLDQSRILPGILSRSSTVIPNARLVSADGNPYISRDPNEVDMDLDTSPTSANNSDRASSIESAVQNYLENLGKQLSRRPPAPQKSSSPPENRNGHTRQSPGQQARVPSSGPLRHGFPTSDSRGMDSQPHPPSWSESKSVPIYAGLYSSEPPNRVQPTANHWPNLSSRDATLAYLPSISSASPAFPRPPVREQMEFVLTNDATAWNDFMKDMGLGGS